TTRFPLFAQMVVQRKSGYREAKNVDSSAQPCVGANRLPARPWAEGFLTVQPAENDVAGTYVIDANSQKRTIKLPQKNSALHIDHSAQVILSTDHKAEFFRVPEEYRGEAACSVTGRGSWRLGKNDNFSVVRASIVNEDPNSPCKGDFAYE